MSLIVRSTAIHIHPGSEPNFAITTHAHPAGAWVVAEDSADQQRFYDVAEICRDIGTWIEITYDNYSEADGDRRFYNAVTDLTHGPVSHAPPGLKNVRSWPKEIFDTEYSLPRKK